MAGSLTFPLAHGAQIFRGRWGAVEDVAHLKTGRGQSKLQFNPSENESSVGCREGVGVYRPRYIQ